MNGLYDEHSFRDWIYTLSYCLAGVKFYPFLDLLSMVVVMFSFYRKYELLHNFSVIILIITLVINSLLSLFGSSFLYSFNSKYLEYIYAYFNKN